MKVVSIDKNLKSGEHDQVWKGKPAKLNIHPTKYGYALTYEIECEHESFIHYHSICAVAVKLKWWHPILGLTEENRVAAGIRRLKRRWKYMSKHTKKFDQIREHYGIHDNGGTV